MQYHSAETHDHSEQDYDIESNQGRSQEENSDTSIFSNYLVSGLIAAVVAYFLYEGIAITIELAQSR